MGYFNGVQGHDSKSSTHSGGAGAISSHGANTTYGFSHQSPVTVRPNHKRFFPCKPAPIESSHPQLSSNVCQQIISRFLKCSATYHKDPPHFSFPSSELLASSLQGETKPCYDYLNIGLIFLISCATSAYLKSFIGFELPSQAIFGFCFIADLLFHCFVLYLISSHSYA